MFQNDGGKMGDESHGIPIRKNITEQKRIQAFAWCQKLIVIPITGIPTTIKRMGVNITTIAEP